MCPILHKLSCEDISAKRLSLWINSSKYETIPNELNKNDILWLSSLFSHKGITDFLMTD